MSPVLEALFFVLLVGPLFLAGALYERDGWHWHLLVNFVLALGLYASVVGWW